MSKCHDCEKTRISHQNDGGILNTTNEIINVYKNGYRPFYKTAFNRMF